MKIESVLFGSSLAMVLAIAGCFFTKKPPTLGTDVDLRGTTSRNAAEKMQELIPVLVNDSNYALLGFANPMDTASGGLILGTPISRIRLRCDSISAFSAESKEANLSSLKFSTDQIFPLIVKGSGSEGQVRSTIVVDSIPARKGHRNAPWVTTEFGNPGLAQAIENELLAHSRKSGISYSQYALVEIPAMGQSFLSYSNPDGVYLSLARGRDTSAVNDTSGCWGGGAGEFLPLLTVLKNLMTRCPRLKEACADPDSAIMRNPKPSKGVSAP